MQLGKNTFTDLFFGSAKEEPLSNLRVGRKPRGAVLDTLYS